MTDKTSEIIRDLNKKGFVAFFNENHDTPLHEFFEFYNIYIPAERASELPKYEFMNVFLASKYRKLIDAVIAKEIFVYAQWHLDNPTTNADIIAKHFSYNIPFFETKYKDKLVLSVQEIVTTHDEEEEIRLRIKTFYIETHDRIVAQYNFNNRIIIPNYCFGMIEDMEEEDYNSMHGVSVDTMMNRQIDRRYKVNASMPTFTNELTDKTKVYTIMDKNIMRAFSDLATRSSFYSHRCVVLNPNLTHFAEEIDKQIPIEHLLALFDYNSKEILKSIKKVSYIKDTITFIGLGGLVSNFLFWCERLREHFELDYVFKNIVICEPDELEFSNLFRIPLNWKDIKLNVSIHDPVIEDILLSQRCGYPERYYFHNTVSKLILMKKTRNIAQKIRVYPEKFTRINLRNAILIGGPDLDTRYNIFKQYYEKESIHFICTTHANNTVSIDTFPKFDRELVSETYGNIDLNKFLLNMFKMSIELINILANKTYIEKRSDKLLDYSVDNENFIANSSKHKCLKNIAYAFN